MGHDIALQEVGRGVVFLRMDSERWGNDTMELAKSQTSGSQMIDVWYADPLLAGGPLPP
jgi:hypothetical protein